MELREPAGGERVHSGAHHHTEWAICSARVAECEFCTRTQAGQAMRRRIRRTRSGRLPAKRLSCAGVTSQEQLQLPAGALPPRDWLEGGRQRETEAHDEEAHLVLAAQECCLEVGARLDLGQATRGAGAVSSQVNRVAARRRRAPTATKRKRAHVGLSLGNFRAHRRDGADNGAAAEHGADMAAAEGAQGAREHGGIERLPGHCSWTEALLWI